MKKNIFYVVIVVAILGMVDVTLGVTNPFAWIYKKIKSCSTIIPLAAKASMQKTSYKTKKAFLTMADRLEKLDPRLTGIAAAEKAAQAALTVAQGALKGAEASLSGAQQGARAMSAMTKAIATFSGKAFNIRKAVFEGNAVDFNKSPQVKLELDAVIAGRPVTVKEVEFDLLLPAKNIKKIIEEIAQKF